MKHVGGRTWQVTEPTPLQIGKPATPPSAAALDEIRAAVSKTGATLVYWFWVSVSGDQPHLGLAVAPSDPGLSDRVVEVVGPIWKVHSPDNWVCDVFRLGEAELDAVIFSEGELLFSSSQNA
jgi:hypothetical protein